MIAYLLKEKKVLTPERKKKNGMFHAFIKMTYTRAYHDSDSGPGMGGIFGCFT